MKITAYLLFISLVIAFGEFIPNAVTSFFPNKVYVDNSRSVAKSHLTKKGIDVSYFSSSVSRTEDTGSRDVTDIEFVLKKAYSEGAKEITVISDFNETTGASLEFARKNPHMIVNTVMVDRFVNPAISAVIAPPTFTPWGTTKLFVSLQGIGFSCELRIRDNKRVIMRKKVDAKSEISFPLDISIHQFKDVTLVVELLFKDSVLSQQQLVLRSPFQQSICLEGLDKNFFILDSYKSRLKPLYGKADFQNPLHAVLIYKPKSQNWPQERVAQLQASIEKGGTAVVIIDHSFFTEDTALRKLFSVSLKEKTKKKNIDIFIDHSLFATPFVTFPQLISHDFNTQAYFWDGELKTRLPATLEAGKGVSLVRGITRLLNRYRDTKIHPDLLVLLTAQKRDPHIIPAPVKGVDVVCFTPYPSTDYSQGLHDIINAKIYKLPTSLAEMQKECIRYCPPQEIVSQPVVLRVDNKKKIQGRAFDLDIGGDIQVLKSDASTKTPLIMSKKMGSGVLYLINFETKTHENVEQALALVEPKQTIGFDYNLVLEGRIMHLSCSDFFTVDYDGVVYRPHKKKGKGFMVDIPVALRGINKLMLKKGKDSVHAYTVFTRVDAESSFSAVNNALAHKLSRITGGDYYGSIEQWNTQYYVDADVRTAVRKIFLLISLLCTMLLIGISLAKCRSYKT